MYLRNRNFLYNKYKNRNGYMCYRHTTHTHTHLTTFQFVKSSDEIAHP